jgi:Cdc6-like AAA superfamily ATPase
LYVRGDVWNVGTATGARGRKWSNGIFIGGGAESYATPQHLLLKYANRHGLIAGATGTGKTVTLQILAERFSMPTACR